MVKKDLFSVSHINYKISTFLMLLEQGDINTGDKIYCSKILEDIFLMEIPTQEQFKSFRSTSVFPWDISYETLTGRQGASPIGNLVKIYKKQYFIEKMISRKEENYVTKRDFYYYLAKSEGFTVKERNHDSHLYLIIYGEFQEDLEEFLENANYTYELYQFK